MRVQAHSTHLIISLQPANMEDTAYNRAVWTSRAIYWASRKDPVVFQHIIDTGLVDTTTVHICQFAIQTGCVETLRIARQAGCVWDAEALDVAIRHGHKDVVAYCLAHGWLVDDRALQLAQAYDANGCLQLVQEAMMSQDMNNMSVAQ